MHFFYEICCILIKFQWKFFIKVLITKKNSLDVTFCWRADNPLSELLMAYITDAYMCQSAATIYTFMKLHSVDDLLNSIFPGIIIVSVMTWVQLKVKCLLTHCGRDKMAAFSQTTFSSAFSWMKMFEFQLKFHWSLFLRVQLTIIHHCFMAWRRPGDKPLTEPMMVSSLTHICVTRPQWVNEVAAILYNGHISTVQPGKIDYTVFTSELIFFCVFLYRMTQNVCPWAHFTQDFPMAIQIWLKFYLLLSNCQWNDQCKKIVHSLTAVLWWHLYKFVA